MRSVFGNNSKMAITWNSGEIIYDKDENYEVITLEYGGMPVRALIPEDADTDKPIAIIIPVYGRGDWVWFDPAYLFTTKSMIPTILNKWANYRGSTEEETKRVQALLVFYAETARGIMKNF